jgi:hypothetical protein
MTARKAPSGQPRRPMASYWPHLGIAIGIVLNGVGAVLENVSMLTVGTNFLTFSAAFLLQRRSNGKEG